MTERDPPKLPLLIKLMGMTTASNDGEALIAIRKANDLLRSADWTWERLLSGKVTVVEDPFAKIDTPNTRSDSGRGAPSTPKKPMDWGQPQTSSPPPSGFGTAAPGHTPRPQKPQPIASCHWCGDPVYDRSYVRGSNFFCSARCVLRYVQQPRTQQAPPPPPPKPSRPATFGLQAVRRNNYFGYCYCCGTPTAALGGYIMSDPNKHGAWICVCDSCNRNVDTLPSHPAKKQNASASSLLNGL